MSDVRKNWYAPHDHHDGMGPHQHFPENTYPGHDHTGVELVPFPSRSIDLLRTTDAKIWADEFVRMHGGDEGLMISWFANAIETGRSAGWQAGLDRFRFGGRDQ